MKDRLIQLLDLEQLNPSKFADLIGVQRSSVSHVISGRNNPSFDFIQKTLRAFPGLNAEWLILGEGSMYEQMGRPIEATLFDAPEPQDKRLFSEEFTTEGTAEALTDDSQTSSQPQKGLDDSQEMPKNQVDTTSETTSHTFSGKEVIQVMVFYGDHTFRTFTPEK